MATYTLFNCCLAVLVVIAAPLLVRSRAQLRAVVQTAAFVTLLAYPWDFFAVELGVWTYGEAGILLHGVPLNDSVFIFLCMFVSAAVFSGGNQSYSKCRAQHDREGQ